MDSVTSFRGTAPDRVARGIALPAELPRRHQWSVAGSRAPAPARRGVEERTAAPRLVAHWERDPEATVVVCGESFLAGPLRLRWQPADPEPTGTG